MSESEKTKRKQKRGNSEGSITPPEKNHGKWKYTLTVCIGADGKQRRRSVSAKTKAELMEKAARLRIECGMATATDKDVTFSDLVKLFLERKANESKSSTLKKYQSMDNTVFVKLYPYKVSKITPDMVNEILNQLKNEGLKNSTVNSYRKGLATVFNFAIKCDIISKSPVRGTVKMAERKRTVMVLPTKSQIDTLLARAKERDSKARADAAPIYPVILLEVATGLRRGELFGLTKADIEGNKVRVDKQMEADGTIAELKTASSYRTITVSRKVLDEVLAYSPDSREVFKITSAAFWQVFKRFVKKNSDILPENFHFHDLRHFHATYLLSKGIGVQNVSRRLGHADIATTLSYYSHYLPQEDERAAELFEDF